MLLLLFLLFSAFNIIEPLMLLSVHMLLFIHVCKRNSIINVCCCRYLLVFIRLSLLIKSLAELQERKKSKFICIRVNLEWLLFSNQLTSSLNRDMMG